MLSIPNRDVKHPFILPGFQLGTVVTRDPLVTSHEAHMGSTRHGMA